METGISWAVFHITQSEKIILSNLNYKRLQNSPDYELC